MTTKKTTKPATPPVPPKAPATETETATPPVPTTETETKKVTSRKVNVKHKKSGNEFEVSAAYYERNKSVLDII